MPYYLFIMTTPTKKTDHAAKAEETRPDVVRRSGDGEGYEPRDSLKKAADWAFKRYERTFKALAK
ncbi:hypothetical protein P24_11080 [Oceanibaculum indicum P24]|uniref:Uncharacterized protein n=2 Tax=Oceanibaculum indicum TaxID=526216 RepID=K2JXK3_9PROT|nr:hypothetical protein P24_11080 [Oceanibaculum indicum P24]